MSTLVSNGSIVQILTGNNLHLIGLLIVDLIVGLGTGTYWVELLKHQQLIVDFVFRV